MLSTLALSLALAGPAVEGRVRLVGEPPERRHFVLDEALRPFHDAEELEDELWLLGERGELANVVVTLHALDAEPPPRPRPAKGAVYAKVGPRYVPRVLVVPVGTELTLRNVDSPCNGFVGRGKRNAFNLMLSAGTERVVKLEHREVIPVRCDLRELMRGVLVVVDTPYYAKSDAAGQFELPAVPAGRYRVRVWHEALGRVEGVAPKTIRVQDGAPVRLELEIPSPREDAEEEGPPGAERAGDGAASTP